MTTIVPRKPRPPRKPRSKIIPTHPRAKQLQREFEEKQCDCDCGYGTLAQAHDGTITCTLLACRKVHAPKESACAPT